MTIHRSRKSNLQSNRLKKRSGTRHLRGTACKVGYQPLEDRRLLAIDVSGAIATDTSWTSNEGYRIVGDVYVQDGATLTINVGNDVTGVSTLDSDYELQVEPGGSLVVNGTKFRGNHNEIIVAPGGNIQLEDSAFDGAGFHLLDGSTGAITMSTLGGKVASDVLMIGGDSTVAFNSNTILFSSIEATGDSANDIDLTNNYWGTVEITEIEARIIDRSEVPTLPTIAFDPFLTNPAALDVVKGTTGDDVIVVDTTSGKVEITINGSAAQISQRHGSGGLLLDGLGGNDILTVNLDDQTQTVELNGSVATIAGIKTTQTTETESATWTTFQGNQRHTGVVDVELDPASFGLDWSREFSTPLQQVTAADGKVFVSSLVRFHDADQFFSLDSNDGSTIWAKNFGNINSVNPPAYANGNVYLQTGNHGDDTYLRAYDADTGSLVFRSPHSAQWGSYLAPTIVDGDVYINGGYYGGMYSFDAISGEQNWFYDLPQYDDWTPAVDDTYAYAFVGEYSPGVYAIDRTSGELAYHIPDPNFDWNGWSMNTAPVLGNANNLLAIHNRRLISFDLVNQDINWESERSFIGTPVLTEGGTIFAIDAGVLSAFDESTGVFLWSWESPSESLNSNLFLTNNLAFVQSDNSTYAIDLTTRESVWSIDATGEMTWSEGKLYLAGTESPGILTVVSTGTVDQPVAPISFLSLSGFGDMTLNSGGGGDSVTFQDSVAADTFFTNGGYAEMDGNGIRSRANGFSNVFATSEKGGADTATLEVANADDFFVFRDGAAAVRGNGMNLNATGFDQVFAEAVVDGSNQAILWGDAGDNRLLRDNGWAQLTNTGAAVEIRNFASVKAHGNGGYDTANLRDTPLDDQFVSNESEAYFSNSAGSFVSLFDFDQINVNSLIGSDSATLTGTSGDDTFYGTDVSGHLITPNGFVYAQSFDSVTAVGGAGNDEAFLTGPAAFSSSKFVGAPTASRLFNDSFFVNAKGFEKAVGKSNGSSDTAFLNDSSGQDVLFATPDFVSLTTSVTGLVVETFGFKNVYSSSSGGGDHATFRDSAENESFSLKPTSMLMLSGDITRFATGFRTFSAIATEGTDIARFSDSAGDDQLFMNPSGVTLKGANFSLFGHGFDRTNVTSIGGNDSAFMEDSDDDDFLGARGSTAWMYDLDNDYFRFINGFEQVFANSVNGGNDRTNPGSYDFTMNAYGAWA